MSDHFAPVPWSLQDCVADQSNKDVDGLTIAVYAALRRFTDFGRDTGAVVSDARIAVYAGCDVRTVQRRRLVLRRLGYLDWTCVPGRPNRYTVRMAPEGEVRSGADLRQRVPAVGQSDQGTTDSQPDNQEPLPRTTTYPAAFEACWSVYPRREGPDNKRAAFRKWQATLRRSGVSPAELVEAARFYAVHCDEEGLTETRFVKQAATFFGPDEHWRDYLEPTVDECTDDMNLQRANW